MTAYKALNKTIYGAFMGNCTLSYALKVWTNSSQSKKQGANFDKNLSIALRYYVLPEFDPHGQVVKPKELENYAQTIELHQLKEALVIFDRRADEAIALGTLSAKTKANYISVLSQFMGWMTEQVWWDESFSDTPLHLTPFRVKPKDKVSKPRLDFYGLREDELNESLQNEIDNFKEFRITGASNLRRVRREKAQGGLRVTRPKIDKIKESCWNLEKQAIVRFLGWYQQHYPDNKLSLSLLTDIQLLDEYAYWLVKSRNTGYSAVCMAVAAGVAIAKWLNYANCDRRNWSDIPLVLDLQDLKSEYVELYNRQKKQGETEKWADKELSHEDARKVVQHLYQLCAPVSPKRHSTTEKIVANVKRRNSAVVRAWQKYIIVKFLVYCPVRQEEIRNLILGKTIFRKIDDQGNAYYVVKLKNHKRDKSGKDRHYRLPSILTPDLDMWIYTWRPLVEQSTKTLENWLDFWGHSIDYAENIEERLNLAKEGIVKKKIRQSLEGYIAQEEDLLRSSLHLRDCWEQAKENFDSHDNLFFLMAKGQLEMFGLPHNVDSIWTMVRSAIAEATTALFGETKWTNPHALRHIAEKHIRLLNKPDMLEAFGTLIGHSKQMGDMYAAQIMTDYDLAEKVANDWWVEPD